MKLNKKRRRFFILLIFPLLAVVFFFSLVASFFRKENSKTGKVNKISAQIAPYDLEMGLILKDGEEKIAN